MSNRKQKENSTEIEQLLSKYKEEDGKIRNENGKIITAMAVLTDGKECDKLYDGLDSHIVPILKTILSDSDENICKTFIYRVAALSAISEAFKDLVGKLLIDILKAHSEKLTKKNEDNAK